jgi:hypothetical protein
VIDPGVQRGAGGIVKRLAAFEAEAVRAADEAIERAE